PSPLPGLDQRLRGYNRKLYGPETRMETARIARPLPLCRRARAADRRRGGARADRVAADSARLARRANRAAPVREAPGDRARQRGPHAVPLPPRFSVAAGAGEVRQARPLRREAPRP